MLCVWVIFYVIYYVCFSFLVRVGHLLCYLLCGFAFHLIILIGFLSFIDVHWFALVHINVYKLYIAVYSYI